MDYKKKYNEAQKWIESIYSELSHEQQMEAEAFFPELKESEDERIRKRIIHALHGDVLDMEETNKALAWLEKQGEKKVSYTTTVETGDGGINALITRDIEIPFGAKDSELQEATYYIPKGYHVKIEDDKVVIKKGEQKPAWSEEDKDFMYDTLSNLTELKDRYGDGYGNVGKCIDWLESLKQRIGG